MIGGEGVLVYIDGWTVLSFWDRTGDRRPNSNSAFLVRDVVSFHTVCAIIQYQYPHLWSRFTAKFEIKAQVT